jgi:L-asparaginase / beta-aspartyl-peptidase
MQWKLPYVMEDSSLYDSGRGAYYTKDGVPEMDAGTSTGGTVLKMPGRVGDSPIIGAGTYANNDSCAVSATGTGEYFIRNVVVSDICARVRYLHVTLDQAANEQHGDGGAIALDPQGHVATPFNTTGMMTGVVRGGLPAK